MKILLTPLVAALLASLSSLLVAQEGLTALNDEALGDVYGQAGIAADLELRINTDASGNPLANLDYCSGDGNPCRMGFLFHNRESGGGEWVTWKSFFGHLKLNNLYVDADQTPGIASPYPDDGVVNRFMSGDESTCLLDGSTKTSTCHQVAQSMPLLALQFNEGGDKGLELFMNLGGVAIEYGETGYNDDLRGAALGVLIGDTRGLDQSVPSAHPAEIKIGGKMGLYGF